jgi:hypothetical protein
MVEIWEKIPPFEAQVVSSKFYLNRTKDHSDDLLNSALNGMKTIFQIAGACSLSQVELNSPV